MDPGGAVGVPEVGVAKIETGVDDGDQRPLAGQPLLGPQLGGAGQRHRDIQQRTPGAPHIDGEDPGQREQAGHLGRGDGDRGDRIGEQAGPEAGPRKGARRPGHGDGQADGRGDLPLPGRERPPGGEPDPGETTGPEAGSQAASSEDRSRGPVLTI